MNAMTIAGVEIPAEPSVITPAIASAIADGSFEAEEAAQIPDIVQYGDRVLEIGAGIGYISTLLDREDRVDHIFAVEANPSLLPFMETVHARNGVTKVTRKNAVLTNEAIARKTFYIREDFWMGSLASGPNPYVDTVEVPTENFNALINKEQISMIVCDVEGAESFLFKGADLSPVTRIYVELHDHITGLNGVRELFDTLGRLDFAYDPRHSSKSVVLFRRVEPDEVLRPYAG